MSKPNDGDLSDSSLDKDDLVIDHKNASDSEHEIGDETHESESNDQKLAQDDDAKKKPPKGKELQEKLFGDDTREIGEVSDDDPPPSTEVELHLKYFFLSYKYSSLFRLKKIGRNLPRRKPTKRRQR